MVFSGDLTTIPNPTLEIEDLINKQEEILGNKELELRKEAAPLERINNKTALNKIIEENTNSLDEIRKVLIPKLNKEIEAFTLVFSEQNLSNTQKQKRNEKIQELEILINKEKFLKTELEKAKEDLPKELTQEELEKLNQIKKELLNIKIISQVLASLRDYTDGISKLLTADRVLLNAQKRKLYEGIMYLYSSMKPLILSLNLISDTKVDPIFDIRPHQLTYKTIRGEDRMGIEEYFAGSGKFDIKQDIYQKDTRSYVLTIQTKPKSDNRGQGRVAFFLRDENIPNNLEVSLRIDLVPKEIEINKKVVPYRKELESSGKIVKWKIEMDLEYPGIEKLFPNSFKNDQLKTELVRSLYNKYLGQGATTHHVQIMDIQDPSIFEHFSNRCAYNILNNSRFIPQTLQPK